MRGNRNKVGEYWLWGFEELSEELGEGMGEEEKEEEVGEGCGWWIWDGVPD